MIKTKTVNTGDWIDIAFSVEEKKPHCQLGLGITPGRAPSAIDYGQWNDLPDLLSMLVNETKAPSMAMAIIKDSKIYKSAVSGVRKTGTKTKSELADRYHIGSVGKSMTAVMIGKLVEENKIAWSTTIGDILTDIEMREDYRDVTVLQLLNHRSGLHAFVDDRSFDRTQFVDDALNAKQQREALVKSALQKDPVGPAGKTMTYSNAGYVVLGVMAERIMAKPFESLMTEYVFGPLKFKHAGFGWPQSEGRTQQPTGHALVGQLVQALEADQYPTGHYLNPAGNVHLSISDLATYAIFHLQALKAQSSILTPEVATQLHTPPEDGNYAAGWFVAKAADGTPKHFHNGSLVVFYAAIFLYPEHDAAIVVASNMGTSVEPDVLKAVEAIFEKEIRQTK
ncbi:beta-lactamase family protein [bacterium]|nr:beta-lactamase family protein [bacterium]